MEYWYDPIFSLAGSGPRLPRSAGMRHSGDATRSSAGITHASGVQVAGASLQQPMYQKVVDGLRSEILDGRIAPDSWIKTADLAQRYAVSAQPVREALQMLQGEGLLTILPNRGARVRGLDRARLEHIYQMREAIEATLTRRFAEESALSDIRTLEDIQDRHDAAIEARDLVQIEEANFAFHDLIVRHSGNEEAMAIRDRYLALTRGLRRVYGFTDTRWVKIKSEHRALIEAFRARDGVEAYLIASKHVRDTRDELYARIVRPPLG
jgi:DNA-binding GntR family transcriptional regulator